MQMTKSEKKEQEKAPSKDESETQNKEQKEKKITPIKEETPEEKLKTVQEKLLRTMAEMENQRRRFEKEKEEAFEFGGFNFAAESLLLIDNIDRAIVSFKNDESLKNNKDLNKIIDGIEIVKKDMISIFKKNGIEAIARSILSIIDKDSAAKLKPPNSKASFFSFSNLLLWFSISAIVLSSLSWVVLSFSSVVSSFVGVLTFSTASVL